MKYSKDLLWSRLNLIINSENIDENIIKKCFDETEKFEKKYSRFIKWNYLYNLNKNKSSQVSWELLSIIKLANQVSKLTDWYFDITILPFLENIWYWIFEEKMEENYWYENIKIENNTIFLQNNVNIDLGSVWKWYIIDMIYNILNLVYDNFIINFWWDIRVKWKHKIFLEDPLDDKKVIWEIIIENSSIASSAPNKRKTKKWHHLINPINKTDDKIAIYVTHKLSSFSDIFSTALFVTPMEKTIEILNKTKWLEALIITKKWEIFKTKWFNSILNNYD